MPRLSLKARPAGSGLVAGPAVRSILDVIGIRDCTTKVFGRQNIYSTVQAVFNAFNSYEDAESVALKRGKRLVDVNDIMREVIKVYGKRRTCVYNVHIYVVYLTLIIRNF